MHDCLGMTIDYHENGKVKISMFDYICKMLDELPKDMSGTAPIPVVSHLFEINSDRPKKLDMVTAKIFHHNLGKLLFLCKRARPDIQTSVAFLCTRVKEPNADDYKKLARTMKYLQATRSLTLTLKAHGTRLIKWWVNGVFTVHQDMKNHTGAMISLGKGGDYCTSLCQKLNTKSSTEAELVAVDKVMPQVMWTWNFLEAQGYGITDNIVFQDNKSAILLEKNGSQSSSKRTQYFNICYFFVQIGSQMMRCKSSTAQQEK